MAKQQFSVGKADFKLPERETPAAASDMGRKTKRIIAAVPFGTYQTLKHLSVDMQRSMGSIVLDAIEDFIARTRR